MLENELIALIEQSISLKCETPNIEYKSTKWMS